MYIQQIYTGCLSQASYYIESEGEVAIVDPIRDIQGYLEIAAQRQAHIRYIFETHFHADFVSGHLELKNKTGAKIIFGPTAKPSYSIVCAKDEQEFPLGKAAIKVIHTPGHTMESSCFLAIDENKKPLGIFTGDTLFIGDVGRVDLAANSELSNKDMAAMLYESLKKIKELPGNVMIYPGHGAGSACGKNISKETTSTIAEQKKSNYAFQNITKEEFIDAVVTGMALPPRYFYTDVKLNHSGYENEENLAKNIRPIEPDQFKKEIQTGTVMLDTRNPEDFAAEHIQGAVNIGLGGQFAIWAGNLFDSVLFLIVCDDGKEKESITRLSRIGYDNVKGFLNGGMKAWKKHGYEVKSIEIINAGKFAGLTTNEDKILDVRNEEECLTGVVKNAITIPLAKLEENLSYLDKNTHYYIYCQGGYRSMIGASILQKNGFNKIASISGGMQAINQTPVVLEIPEMAHPKK